MASRQLRKLRRSVSRRSQAKCPKPFKNAGWRVHRIPLPVQHQARGLSSNQPGTCNAIALGWQASLNFDRAIPCAITYHPGQSGENPRGNLTRVFHCVRHRMPPNSRLLRQPNDCIPSGQNYFVFVNIFHREGKRTAERRQTSAADRHGMKVRRSESPATSLAPPYGASRH